MVVVCRNNASYAPFVLLLGAIEDVAIVLALQAAQELKEDDESDHGGAGPEEGRVGRDAPAGGDEAGVNCIPVPEHLVIEEVLLEEGVSDLGEMVGKEAKEETH